MALNPTSKEVADNSLFESWLNGATGIPIGVIRRMDDADDWTFVITLHAMMEAVLNNMIIVKLGYLELREIVSKMDTGDRQRGKLAWAKQLGLLTERERKFIRTLSELRNNIVHNIRNFEFSFQKWISEMKPADFKNFKDSMPESMPEGLEIDEGVFLPWEKAAREHPRDVTLTAATAIMVRAHNEEVLVPLFYGQLRSTPKESS